NQVLNNLLINAAQAMKHGGRITVKAANTEIAAAPALPLEPGSYVKIEVADDGPGIALDILPRIFDPYFTTKKGGSGLGLATAYSIIKHHDGHIMVDSEQGHGATFTFYLPAIPSAVVQIKEQEFQIYHGKGRILLMDDEILVRQIAGEMLGHLGYDVAFAINGAEAVELYREQKAMGTPFDAVFLDLTVPGGIGGREVIEELLPDNPELKTVLTSGYANNHILMNYGDYGFSEVLQKPYTIQQLSWVLRKLLAGNSPENSAQQVT
ncbi:MAG: ATP-binding protein, partial [Verrucomicrobiota bacterium]